MCGITGIFAFNLVGKFNKIHVTKATQVLHHRGPDFQDIHLDPWVALGHRRLSVIDTSDHSNQPMWDEQKRYCIVFNGEIFNYREIREELIGRGISINTNGDTEVLLRFYIEEKENCLSRLNGFFSFCVYDRQEESLFIARDRFGIKPLLYCFDEDKFIFASEMKSMVEYGIDRTPDYDSIYTYLQLNYIPAPHTAFRSVKKLLPGCYIKVKRGQIDIHSYYSAESFFGNGTAGEDYTLAQERLKALLEKSVERRLIADVPAGAFLSGGIDSSIITGIASRFKPDLHTFSIGFRDEKFFDETPYANLVAKHFNTRHTVFSLSNDDLYNHVHEVLRSTDEPFADSSAIAVYILSKETRKHVTVALSGDGADEMFGGYNKHTAFSRALNPGWKEKLAASMLPLWQTLPSSRNSSFSNRIRQFKRFAEGYQIPNQERYWKWASFANEAEAAHLLHPLIRQQITSDYQTRKNELLKFIKEDSGINEILLTDLKLVLPNDMLMKVDLMSMANSLEVRVPFLDFEVVNFVSSLPPAFKVAGKERKRILRDAYRDFLPQELYHRPKKGFEVPLLKWFRKEMRTLIVDDLLSDRYIEEQGIFDPSAIAALRNRLFSSNPGDVHARIWGLIVFQSWWKRVVKGGASR